MKGELEMHPKATAKIQEDFTDTNLLPSYWATMGKELIDKEYSHLRNVEDVCSRLGISPSHFRDVFHMAFGVNPKLYLERVKVGKAMELLKDGSAMVYDVAMKVGIPQRIVFEKIFKKVVGVPPSQFRKTSSSGEIDTRKRHAK
ncbi:MAG: helix-turn-helix domain-containing protein [Candidatus Kryptoniota bacterium]